LTILRALYYIALLLVLLSCQAKTKTPSEVRCAFSADSAYAYVAHQVAYGARTPGSDAHIACGDWLIGELARHGAQAKSEYGTMTNYAGEAQEIRNVVAYFEGHTSQAILLCAHWDCRPWCDEEEIYEKRFQPVMGANDGASGVGVILEIVRQLNMRRANGEFVPSVLVAFFDCEDMGTPNHYTGKDREHTWCLGSQLWAKDYQQSSIKCQYGVLLDMVGDPSATFPREYFSVGYAANYVELIWRTAIRLGYGRYFVNQNVSPILDDHYYVNSIAGIPCVDIIDYKPDTGTGFAHWWHTQQDDMRNINKQTLQAVGETVLTTICSK
jgi:hypothetical protein